VVADRLRADPQLAGDRLVGQTLHDQPQHVDLTGGEAGRAAAAGAGLGVSVSGQHRFGRGVIEAPVLGFPPHLGRGILTRQCGAMRTRLGHGPIGIGRRQHACRGGQHRAADPAVVAGAVHALVMRRRQEPDAPQRFGPVEDALHVVDVHAHALVVAGGQRSGSVPH